MNRFVFSILAFTFSTSFAAEIKINAELDQTEISLDESVSLRISVESDGISPGVEEPVFQSDSFDTIGNYSNQSIQSVYENDKFSMKSVRTFTYVLKPKTTGTHKISGISVKAGNQSYTASDLSVRVGDSGAGTPPPQGYRGAHGLGGAGVRTTAKPFFIQAELSQSRVFKGQQLIVSYYLYSNAQIFNIEVTKYPVLEGFLREDLQIPVLQRQLNWKPVVINGARYEKALLAQYAAYPLKDGTLPIDTMTVRSNYHGRSAPNRPMDDDEDPFMQNFFNRLSPRVATESSQKIKVDVEKLPEGGRPNVFSGGVGDFNISARLSDSKSKVNDAVKFNLRIEGRGNVAGIKKPEIPWPADLELYDSKETAVQSQNGVGSKEFEFLLIPRKENKFTIPKVVFLFFDPLKKAYYERSTDSVALEVSGTGIADLNSSQPKKSSNDSSKNSVAENSAKKTFLELDLKTIAMGLGALMLLLIGTLVVFSINQKKKLKSIAEGGPDYSSKPQEKTKSPSKFSMNARLREVEKALETSKDRFSQSFGSLIFEALAYATDAPVRSMSRSELRELLISKSGRRGQASVDQILATLDWLEAIRYSGEAAGDRSSVIREGQSKIAEFKAAFETWDS